MNTNQQIAALLEQVEAYKGLYETAEANRLSLQEANKVVSDRCLKAEARVEEEIERGKGWCTRQIEQRRRAERAEAELAAMRNDRDANAPIVLYPSSKVGELAEELKAAESRVKALGGELALHSNISEGQHALAFRLKAKVDAFENLLRLSRPYVERASGEMYDGGQGANIRATAVARLEMIDAALATRAGEKEVQP